MRRLLFQTGGPWHPVDAQAALLQDWLGRGWQVETAPGAQALDRLDGVDLFVAAGMEWPGMDSEDRPEAWSRAGIARSRYVPPTEAQKAILRRYVGSGRPVLVAHGGILCFEDWPEYGHLVGFRWHWGYTGHSVEDRWTVTITDPGHPTVAGVAAFEIFDELYFNVVVPPNLPLKVHARAHLAEWVDLPMVITAEGEAGRIAGAGRTAYLANGHSLQALQAPGIRPIWLKTVAWLCGDEAADV